MSVNSSVKQNVQKKSPWQFIVLPLWVIIGYLIANFIVLLAVEGLKLVGLDLGLVNESVLAVVVVAAVYLLAFAVVLCGPLILKSRTSLGQLGIDKWPTWRDIILAPIAYIVYLVVFVALVALLMNYWPIIDFEQTQEIMFNNLSQRYEYLLAFIALVVLAPIAEEVLFRGYLYGRLRRQGAFWVSAVVTSLVFAGLHGQWNVAIDTFILSMVMCGLREYTGSIWAGVLVHMIKNGVAYFALFISPLMFSSLL